MRRGGGAVVRLLVVCGSLVCQLGVARPVRVRGFTSSRSVLTSLSRSRVPGVTVREQAWLYFMRTRVSFLLIHGDSINVWWREYYQRGYSTRVIADDYRGKRYVLVVCDADEIPSTRYGFLRAVIIVT